MVGGGEQEALNSEMFKLSLNTTQLGRKKSIKRKTEFTEVDDFYFQE